MQRVPSASAGASTYRLWVPRKPNGTVIAVREAVGGRRLLSDVERTDDDIVLVRSRDVQVFRGGRGRGQLQPRSPAVGKVDDWPEGLSCFASLAELVENADRPMEVDDDYFIIDATALSELRVFRQRKDPKPGHRSIRPDDLGDLKLWMESAHTDDKSHPGHRFTQELYDAIVPNENNGKWRKLK